MLFLFILLMVDTYETLLYSDHLSMVLFDPQLILVTDVSFWQSMMQTEKGQFHCDDCGICR